MAERRVPAPRRADPGDLAQALRAGLESGPPVDVASLSAGAREAARRIRRRRRIGVSVLAALAVAAVPLGVASLRPGLPPAQVDAPPVTAAEPGPGGQAESGTGPVGTGPADAGTGPADAGTGPADAGPLDPGAPDGALDDQGESLPGLADPGSVPDDAALRPGDLGRPLVVLSDLGDYPKGPPVDGQGCGEPDPGDAVPSTRRAWMWAEESSNRLDQLVVDQVVTGWPPGDGPQVVDDIAAGTGWCRFLDDPAPVPPEELRGPVVWAATAPAAGGGTGYAVVRLGDVVVSVSVDHPDGEQAAVAEAQRLAGVAAGRVADSLG